MMTSEPVHIGRRAELNVDEMLWELELLDSDWVDAEFTAIMIASGFGDRIIVAMDPAPRENGVRVNSRGWHPRGAWDRRRRSARVRSPPAGQ